VFGRDRWASLDSVSNPGSESAGSQRPRFCIAERDIVRLRGEVGTGQLTMPG